MLTSVVIMFISRLSLKVRNGSLCLDVKNNLIQLGDLLFEQEGLQTLRKLPHL